MAQAMQSVRQLLRKSHRIDGDAPRPGGDAAEVGRLLNAWQFSKLVRHGERIADVASDLQPDRLGFLGKTVREPTQSEAGEFGEPVLSWGKFFVAGPVASYGSRRIASGYFPIVVNRPSPAVRQDVNISLIADIE